MVLPVPSLYQRLAPVFIVSLAVLSIVDLGLGAKHAKDLSKEPIDQYVIRHWGKGPTGAQIAFYCATLPFVSTIYGFIEAAWFIYGRSFKRVVASLVGSVVLLVGWVFQVSFWTNCEEVSRDDNGLQRYCPQWAMRKVAARDDGLGSSLQLAKYSFGWIITFGYFGYMTFLAVLIDKTRKAEKARARNAPVQFSVETKGGSEESQL